MLAGQLDLGSVTRDQEPAYKSNANFAVQSFPAGDWYGIAFRTDTAPARSRARGDPRRGQSR
jgi:hypothetical protein